MIEEALAEIYKRLEHGSCETASVCGVIDSELGEGTFNKLVASKLVRSESGQISFTESGKHAAAGVIRRCRLSERLLADVLNIQIEALSAAACQFEHVLSTEVTDSICTLLGHPTACPHDNPIPRGACCGKSGLTVKSVVVPLDKLATGQSATLSYVLFKKNPDLYRLLSLGLVPGSRLKIIERVPTFVVELGSSQLAFDEQVAKDIFVRPLESGR